MIHRPRKLMWQLRWSMQKLKTFLKSKQLLGVTILLITIFGFYYADNEINNFKDIDNLSSKIQSFSGIENFDLVSASPSQFPIKLDALKNNKGAYFLIEFEFLGRDIPGYENFFQTASGNSGIRLEQHGQSIALIIADSGKNKYTAIELTKNIEQDKLYQIKIEALANEFLRIYFDRKEIRIQSPNIQFSMEELLIGAGFNFQRKYSGDLINISVKTTNYYSPIAASLKYYPLRMTSKGYFLTLVAKAGIFLAVIFFFIFKLFKKNIKRAALVKKREILLLLACQIILIYCYPAYRNSLVVYGFLFVLGFYPIRFLALSYLKIDAYIWLFSPLMGLMLFSLFGAYAIAFNYSVGNLTYLFPLALFFILFQIITSSNNNPQSLKHILRSANLQSYAQSILNYLTILIAPLILILTIPSIQIDGWDNILSSTPLRVGPDAALYSRMAQYLLDGGTWAYANLDSARFEKMSVGEITKYTNATMQWPFLYFYRWGLVSYQYINVALNGIDHIYRVAFTSMVIPHLLLGGLTFFWLREQFSLSLKVSIAGALGIIFNVNLLNLWYEGFYGNVYSLCLYTFFYFLVTQIQGFNIQFSKSFFKFHFLVSLVLASILVSYGEGLLFVFIPLMGISFLISLVIERKVHVQIYGFLISCLFVAIVMILPCEFIYDWLLISIKQITEEGGNGYPQPYWATINEILGLNNIYGYMFGQDNLFDGKAHIRSTLNYVISILSTILIFLVLAFNVKNDKNNSIINLNLSAYFLILIFVIYYYRVSPQNNYGYMKMYVFLTPLLFVYFIKAYVFCGYYFKLVSPYMFKGGNSVVAISCVMILNGISYIVTYSSTATLVKPSYLKSHEQMRNINISDKILYPIIDNKFVNTLPALIGSAWISKDWDDINIEDNKYFKDLLNQKIFIFIEKNPCLKNYSSSENVFYEDENFIIIDTHLTLNSQLINGKFNRNRELKQAIAVHGKSECISLN